MVPRFRCWDKDSKVMRSWKDLILTKDDGDDFWLIGYKENSCITSFDHDQILMQSTGLKDKNGVEIFEGDIIVWEYSEKPQEVFWDNSICGFSTKHYHLWRTVKKVKVIGNIYENPELLEPANEN